MGLLRIMILSAVIYGGVRLVRRFMGQIGQKRAEQAIPTEQSGVMRKVTYHDNGRMASERYLMDGVMHGAYMIWDHRGNKLAEGEYRNGMLHGSERRFGPDGREIGVVQWDEGRRTDTRKEGADGELISLRLVSDDSPVGVPDAPIGGGAPVERDPADPDPS